MASTCPNCGRKLKWYEIKAECKACGVSIPNFNWEARLEEDSARAEAQSLKFHRGLSLFTYSVWGTKLRIARIILSFIPIVGFIVPWASLQSESGSVGFDLLGLFTGGRSLLALFQSFFADSGLYFTNMAYEGYSGPLTFSMLGVLFMVLTLLMAVIAFFLILFTNKKPKNLSMTVFECLSVICAVTAAVMFTRAGKAAESVTAFNFGDLPMFQAHSGVMWGFFVALVLLCVAALANLLVAKAPAKSVEELETERLAKKAAKEEKERENELRKEKERREAEAAAEEEQKRIVEEARAKLQKDKKKN
ncbi:MAG: hypothetical protein IJ168_04210 [Eubacterium sp.]|nr:hypothetical protein [Eubacterium sp.]